MRAPWGSSDVFLFRLVSTRWPAFAHKLYVREFVFATGNVLANCCWVFGIKLLKYVYTYTTQGNFTNMSAVVLMRAIAVFLVGFVSDQVTALLYKDIDRD